MQTLLSIGQCVEPGELDKLLTCGKRVVAYNGFEPSGQMTLAQCMTAVINVNKFVDSGVDFVFWVADTFAELNNKLGRDKAKIRRAGELMIEIWKVAGMRGIDTGQVKFLWASEEIAKDPARYWALVMDISQSFTLDRMIKCTPALGRAESDTLYMSTLMYSAMQCADVFYLGVDICQMGLDQLKINMLVREYCDKIKRRHKPVILSHQILGGLDGNDKMSKSNPDTAIFMTDNELDVERKIKRAFCKPGEPTGPIFDICRDIIFSSDSYRPFIIDTERQFLSFHDLVIAFAANQVHPADLKKTVAARINELLEPVRIQFSGGNHRGMLEEVQKYKLTK